MPDPLFHPALPKGLTFGDVAAACGGKLADDAKSNIKIFGVEKLLLATEKDLSYCGHKSFVDDLKQTKAGLCLVTQEFAVHVPANTVALIVGNPSLAYAKVAEALYPQAEAFIHKTAQIAPTAKIGKNATIGAYAVIGDNVQIGDNCKIGSHCNITHAILGHHVVLYAGARIGQEGFGYVFDAETGRHQKIPQLGRVIIGNYVEIGANATIDRGALGDTVIGDNCIIDNLVQVAHNVELGRGVILIAQAGIAGSAKIGNYAIIAAQAGVADHLQIGDKAQIGAQSGVMRDVPDGAKVLGSPAVPIRQMMRQVATLERLSERKTKNE